MKAMIEDLLRNKDHFNHALNRWYQEYHRKLPWRTEPSLYKTVISEFMLQQTQVDTVLPYFERWLAIFPDFGILAQAREEDVVKQWEGLGYYSRARNLHKLAQKIVEFGDIPKDLENWLEFPGVGPYTAAAITSIAFGEPNAVVDGNVIRILTRLTANQTEFKEGGSAIKSLSKLANDLLNREDPNTHNQAMMELGATICVRSNPLCTVCPVVHYCAGFKQGVAERLPNIIRKKIEHIVINRIWIIQDERILLMKIGSSAKRLANMYELPEINDDFGDLSFRTKEPWAVKKRGISNQQIKERIYKVDYVSPVFIERLKTHNNLEWIALKNLSQITLSGPHKRWINELLLLINNDSISSN